MVRCTGKQTTVQPLHAATSSQDSWQRGRRGTCLDTTENSQPDPESGKLRQLTLFLPEVNIIKMGRGRYRVAET